MSTGQGHRLRVAEVVEETADARSIVFAVPPELAARFHYRPGQFLTLRVPLGGDRAVARCYSLCDPPTSAPERLTVTVKATPDGLASRWLCEHASPGMEFDVLPPGGRFTPRSLDGDFLLVAAGSGITPVLSILGAALGSGTGRVTLLYANRDETSVIFASRLRDLRARHPERLTVVHWLESVSGLPDAAALAGLLRPWADTEAYLCGPAPFMAAAQEALRDLGSPRIHVEKFESLTEDPFTTVTPEIPEGDVEGEPFALDVELDGEHHELDWPPHRKLLDVLVAQGLAAPSSCREGRCGACTCKLLSGDVEMPHNEVLDDQDLADGYVLACQALPRTGPVRVTYDD